MSDKTHPQTKSDLVPKSLELNQDFYSIQNQESLVLMHYGQMFHEIEIIFSNNSSKVL